jgi:hypothetical protein
MDFPFDLDLTVGGCPHMWFHTALVIYRFESTDVDRVHQRCDTPFRCLIQHSGCVGSSWEVLILKKRALIVVQAHWSRSAYRSRGVRSCRQRVRIHCWPAGRWGTGIVGGYTGTGSEHFGHLVESCLGCSTADVGCFERQRAWRTMSPSNTERTSTAQAQPVREFSLMRSSH